MFGYATIKLSATDMIRILELCQKNPDKDIPLKIKSDGDGYVLVNGKTNKDVGTAFSKDLLKTIKSEAPELFQDVETLMIEKELFLVNLAQLMFDIPVLINEFEKIYQENPLRYYRAAMSSKYYDHPTLNDGNLMGDIAIKRAFGVLLAAEDNIQLQERVEGIFYSYDKRLKRMIQEQSRDLVERLEDDLYKKSSALSSHIFAYLLLNHHDGTHTPVLNYLVNCASRTDELCEKRGGTTSLRAYLESNSDPFEYIEFSSDYVWKVIKETLSFKDIMSMTMAYEYDLGVRHDEPYNPKIKELIVKCPKNDPCYREIQEAQNLIWAFGTSVNLNGLASIRLFFNKAITKTEQKVLLKEYSWMHKQQRNLPGNRRSKVKLQLDTYVALLLLHFWVQNEVEVKKTFFENNNETMFSHVSVLNDRIEQLQQEKEELLRQLDKLREEAGVLRGEIESFITTAQREEKGNRLPYLGEISLLKKEKLALEKQLTEEQERTKELNLLREYAFAVQSEYVPDEIAVNLEKIVEAQKIVIIGGHINWRNNLKKKYPLIITMDGHLATADFSVLKTADFVFLNVSNMSHSVYYKVMNVLRMSSVPFDYLGRTINQELYEKEMADILLRHEMKKAK